MSIRRQCGFTLVELLVVIAIIGVLVAILVPAIGSARESARRTQCTNHLRQLAAAVIQFEGARGVYPPARLQTRPGDINQCGGNETTWLVRVLPYLEEEAAYRRWDLYRPWYNHVEAARLVRCEAYFCPSRRSAENGTVGREVAMGGRKQVRAACGCSYWVSSDVSVMVEGIASDYAGNHGDLSPGNANESTDFYYGGNGNGILISSRPRCEAGQATGWIDRIAPRHVRDGLSRTFLLGEKHVARANLGQFPFDAPAVDGEYLPASARLAGPGVPLSRGIEDLDSTDAAFGSWHPGVCSFALADGAVITLSNDTSTRVLGEYANRKNSAGSSR